MILNIVTGQIKQPHFLSQASRFYSLSLDGEPSQNIIGWTKNDENENGCLFQQKTDNLCFYTTWKVMFGVKIRGFEVRESIHVVLKLIQIIEIQDG